MKTLNLLLGLSIGMVFNLPAQAQDYSVLKNIEYCDSPGATPLVMDIYSPLALTEKAPAVVLVHGGGWRGGDKSRLTEHAKSLAQSGYVALSVNYRLTSPNSNVDYDEIIADIKCAVRSIKANASTYNIDRKRIGIFGTSAGGHLALQTGLQRSPHEDAGQYSRYTSDVAAVVNWYGPANLIENYMLADAAKPAVSALIGGDYTPDEGALTQEQVALNQKYWYASPTAHVDLYDPPVLTIHSEEDGIVKIDISKHFDALCRSIGLDHQLITVTGTKHAIPDKGLLFTQAMEDSIAFLDAHL